MKSFATLLDRLVFTRSRHAKLRLIADYLTATPDPDRGWALAALTGELDIAAVKPALIRTLIEERVDPVLYRMSRDYVGDTAETVALLWPSEADGASSLRLAEAIDRLNGITRRDAPRVMAELLDALDPVGRYALIKMATGALRIGISARLAKTALAQAFALDVEAVEEVWHGLAPPYQPLFDWAEGRAARPVMTSRPVFRPFMLAHPLEDIAVSLDAYAAEWKWDGIRVQLVHMAGETRLFSRGGDDITGSFPDIAGAFTRPGVVDGELLVRGETQGGDAGSFNALQQRLGRKTVSPRMLADYPAFVRLYDLLFDGDEDLRGRPWHERRQRLEAVVPTLDAARFDLSVVIDAPDFEALGELRARARDGAIEGIMLKRRDSPYIAGRKVGLWYKWKRDPLSADCVLMYAQRGSGKRSSFFSDFTFGAWNGDPEAGAELLPVGKAYFGFTDEELKVLDRFVRTHTLQRFGPVAEVEKSLVFEVAFDSIHASRRHKSGLAMRFPRIARIRHDKPAHEADRIETLRAMVT